MEYVVARFSRETYKYEEVKTIKNFDEGETILARDLKVLREARKMAREHLMDTIEVYGLHCKLENCIELDCLSMYAHTSNKGKSMYYVVTPEYSFDKSFVGLINNKLLVENICNFCKYLNENNISLDGDTVCLYSDEYDGEFKEKVEELKGIAKIVSPKIKRVDFYSLVNNYNLLLEKYEVSFTIDHWELTVKVRTLAEAV